ncbi:P-loop containing nucleoside triphosphate hydrolase protein [Powellomyces hirtus]|nr:P-loop containing nucleoside triphosphate hydrolase protein [Powellomyces hirtus]
MIFEASEYQDIIDKINKLRSYGLNKMITIPQIAILGDQSSGKSSVLEAITQLSFPRNMETCTRFATQVSLRQSERVEMAARIDDEPEFNARYQAQDTAWDLHTIISEANTRLCSNVEISEKVLEITISGPTLAPLTIIDLPGYINTTVDGQDKSIVQTIRDINTRYIKDSRTIILAVVPASIDLNNIFVLGEAERYDPTNERTVPIVTKPDTVEPELLRNLVQTLLNKRKHMKLGYLVMRNSSFSDIGTPWEEAKKSEDDFFTSSPLWKQIQDTRKGRIGVKRFLGDLLYAHIKKELPLLKKDILNLIGEVEREIQGMGPPVSSPAAAKAKYYECILKLKSSLTALLAGNYSFEYISKHKSSVTKQDSADENESESESECDDAPPTCERDCKFIRSSLQGLYQHYNRGDELPGFVSFTTFAQIYTETLVRWREMTAAHVANMHVHLYKAVASFIAFDADPLLKDTLLLEFFKFYGTQTAKIKDAIQNIFTDEESPLTMNKYYYDNITNSRRAKAEKHIRELMTRFTHNAGEDPEPVDLDDEDINYNERFAVEDLQEQLQSYCKVARKRIVDVVLLQTIERYMIKEIALYFDILIAGDDSVIASQLLESPIISARRQELQDKVVVLRRSLLEL